MIDRPLAVQVLGFVALAVTVLTAVWLDAGQQRAFGWVQHTLEVENRLSTIMTELQDAESSERGYVLSGRGEFLAPYDRSVYRLETEIDALALEVSDNPRQMAAVSRLRGVVQRRLALAQESVSRFQQGDAAGARDTGRLLQGRVAMDQARTVIAGMRSEEERLLQLRQASARSQGRAVTLVLLASVLAAGILGVVAYRDGARRLRRALDAGNALAAALQRAELEVHNRESAEDQLRQVQRLESVGQLTGGIAHDFNNMLAIVLGSLELARRRLTGAEDARVVACIDNAMDGAERAAQLTARLLAFSRQQALSPRPLDANKLVAGMSELLRRTIGEQLHVETVLAGGLWTTFVDPGQLENAVLNLAVNARDAMPEGGKLTIETSNAHLDADYAEQNETEPGQYVLVSVTDTGMGMPAQVIARAFDPFFTTKAPGQGTGLGLSQVFGFVKQSGGHVKIYSELGVGSTVKLYLPRHRGRAAAEPEAAAGAEPPRGSAEEVVLVVEDEERVRHLSVDALRELGYTVVQAADAAQALALLTVQPKVDLLFTDVVMPDMNGRRLADQAIAQKPGLKVLYTTGYTRNAIVHNGVLDANVAFLPKPYTLDQLALTVRRVLEADG
jgi:signal transduction histidine kinase